MDWSVEGSWVPFRPPSASLESVPVLLTEGRGQLTTKIVEIVLHDSVDVRLHDGRVIYIYITLNLNYATRICFPN